MDFYTTLYLILALGIAFGVSYYQYFYKTIYKGKIYRYLAALRGFTFFLIALLFINPKITNNTYSVEKPQLILAVDNSQSITFFKADNSIIDVIKAFKSDKPLNKKFDIQSYSFGKELIKIDSFNFTETQTDIANTLQQLNTLYSKNTALVVLTDGNQTSGIDYTYFKSKFPINSLVVGDTSRFIDLKIAQINHNDFTYMGNDFPVEVFLNYNGNKPISTLFTVSEKGKVVYKKQIAFSANENSKILKFKLKTTHTGIHQFKTVLGELENEKNLKNNQFHFSINTLSEQSNILIISSINHPDIGALKRSIERNKQRKVTVVVGKIPIEKLGKYQLIIVYQPTTEQQLLFDELRKERHSYFVITGTQTDWNFLNKTQEIFKKKFINKGQEYLPLLNKAFNPYAVEDFGFNDLPPLEAQFGTINFRTKRQVLLYQKIGNIALQQPLLATFKTGRSKGAVLFGENLWQWRMATYTAHQNFEGFDGFINTLVQYLVELKSAKQLVVDYKSVVYDNQLVDFWVKYLDETKKFDARAQLEIELNAVGKKSNKVYPLALEDNYYHLNLPDLEPDTYNFTIVERNSKLSYKGNFVVLDFPIEQQFYNANFKKLELLTENNEGKTYLLDNFNVLKTDLLKDNRFKSIQKKKERISDFLSFKWLLLLIITSAVTEWFMRKHHGLI